MFSKQANCSWSQTDSEIEFKVSVPSGTRGKDVQYALKSKHVSVGLSGQVTIDNMELCHAVIPGDSHWQIEDGAKGRDVVVTLRKARAGVTWRALMLLDCPKPPLSSHDTDFKGWTTEEKGATKSKPAAPLLSFLPPALSSVEPGTLAACFFLLVSMCVGLFKTYMARMAVPA